MEKFFVTISQKKKVKWRVAVDADYDGNINVDCCEEEYMDGDEDKIYSHKDVIAAKKRLKKKWKEFTERMETVAKQYEVSKDFICERIWI